MRCTSSARLWGVNGDRRLSSFDKVQAQPVLEDAARAGWRYWWRECDVRRATRLLCLLVREARIKSPCFALGLLGGRWSRWWLLDCC